MFRRSWRTRRRLPPGSPVLLSLVRIPAAVRGGCLLRVLPLDPSEYDGLGDAQFLALGQDRFVQGLAEPAVILAEMDAYHAGRKLFLHSHASIQSGCFRVSPEPRWIHYRALDRRT